MDRYWQNIKHGTIYKAFGVGRHSEAPEVEMVVYENAKGELWVRPKELFFKKFRPATDFTDLDWERI